MGCKFSGFSGYSIGWLLQIMEPLVNYTHYCSRLLTTIAKFSGFSGYSKGWLLQIMEPLVNYTHYCSSDSYRTLSLAS